MCVKGKCKCLDVCVNVCSGACVCFSVYTSTCIFILYVYVHVCDVLLTAPNATYIPFVLFQSPDSSVFHQTLADGTVRPNFFS